MAIVYLGNAGGGSGGGVQDVTAADTSIVVGGTAAHPTVRTGTLDVIAADHPAAADWSNNAHKITGLANGSAASDAAAFGQIPQPGLVLLYDSTLGSPAASIDTGANGIAAGHYSLLIQFVGRTSEVVNGSTVLFRFNGDSGANYDKQTLGGAGSTATAAVVNAATSLTHGIPGSTHAANYPGVLTLAVPSYDQTTFYKTVNLIQGFGSTSTDQNAFVVCDTWRNTAAVAQLSATAGSGNLVTGSRLTIWGLA